MAQNDPVFSAGDEVLVYDTPGNRARAEHGESIPARSATIAREHPSEPGTLELVFDDGHSEFITDTQRLRPAAK